MFGRRRVMAKLERELAELCGEVAALRAELAKAGPLFSDGGRSAQGRSEDARIRAVTEAGDEVNARPEAASSVGVRRKVPLDSIERATVTGYVSISFTGGRTDTVRLLVGDGESPDTCVGEASSGGGGDAYVGGMVRAGETWQAQSTVGASRSGFICWFTPIF